MKKILVTLPVNEQHKAYLAGCLKGAEDRYEIVYTEGKHPSEEQLAASSVLLGIYNSTWPYKAPHAEWVQLASAGYDAFVSRTVTPENVLLTSCVGAYGLAVSEHMLAMTYYILRKLGRYSRNQAVHNWHYEGAVASVEGSVVAVLGMGDIGCSYAQKVKALGAHVIGVRRRLKEMPECFDEQFTMDDIDKVLPVADIVAMVIPGGADNYHIINEEKLRMMKPGAFLINAGRGNSLDCEALKKVLKEGRFAGVALDVTEPEPLPEDDELWDMDNVFITPHVAGGIGLPETLNRIVNIIGQNLKHYVNGEPLVNVVEH